MPPTNDSELKRYRASLCLPDFDWSQQQLLLDSSVTIVGAGGLGCSAALFLAGAGVGQLEIVDHDRVDISNLQRQIAYCESDLGRYKAEALVERLRGLNSSLRLRAHTCRFEAWQPSPGDLLLDCSDNLATRWAINSYCHQAQLSLLSAAAAGYEGQLFVCNRAGGLQPACYACLYREAEDAGRDCRADGVFAPLVGLIGSWQAAMALELLLHPERHPSATVLRFALSHELQSYRLSPRADCPVCASSPG